MDASADAVVDPSELVARVDGHDGGLAAPGHAFPPLTRAQLSVVSHEALTVALETSLPPVFSRFTALVT